ncbi:MAG TPA: hypothetical protein VHL34_18310 [Rhizomicrobium sp.]|jgi:hypothetical protein|nr:hypothetical protein [Rhizomicrobium sp.]
MTCLKSAVSALAVLAFAASTANATGFSRPIHPLHPTGHVGAHNAPLTNARSTPTVTSGTWTPLTNPFPGSSFPDTALLLTDGTVIMHGGCTREWWRLTPDNKGNYAKGTWTQIAMLPKGYLPLYFASQVLSDGRVIMNGGEYINCNPVWSNAGAIYDPVADKWTSVTPPPGWNNIGDAQSTVLSDGSYMLADLNFDAVIASISGNTVTWTPTGTGKGDRYNEEGWTIIPDQRLFTVDANRALDTSNSQTEIYTPLTGTWTTVKQAPAQFTDPVAHEIGPGVLMASGKVFQLGANSCADPSCPGHTGLYDPAKNKWTLGPDIPGDEAGLHNVSDGPAALLPNGHVLFQASPNAGSNFNTPSHFYEFDGTSIVQVNEPSSAPNIAAYEGRMLLLPSGQVFWSADVGDVEVYTPTGKPVAKAVPTIISSPATVKQGKSNYSISGTMFNGVSEGAYYGDDAQSSTNYPIVRIKNNATGHVCFAKTHDFSKRGIGVVGETVTAQFNIPAATPRTGILPCETGASTLQVIVNGIPSAKVNVTVNAG